MRTTDILWTKPSELSFYCGLGIPIIMAPAHRVPGGLQPGVAPGDPGRLPAAGSPVHRPVAAGPREGGTAGRRRVERRSSRRASTAPTRSTRSSGPGRWRGRRSVLHADETGSSAPPRTSSPGPSPSRISSGATCPSTSATTAWTGCAGSWACSTTPTRGLRIIHVAGTKGKGSTSALLASVLHAGGHRTGLYTSPHVTSAFERIAIAGEEPRPELLVRLGREVQARHRRAAREGHARGISRPPRSSCTRCSPSSTSARPAASDAVIEVGIGGRLDATNVVMSGGLRDHAAGPGAHRHPRRHDGEDRLREGGHHQAGRPVLHRVPAARGQAGLPGRGAESAAPRDLPRRGAGEPRHALDAGRHLVPACSCGGTRRWSSASPSSASSRRRTPPSPASPCGGRGPRSPSRATATGFLAASLPGRMEVRGRRTRPSCSTARTRPLAVTQAPRLVPQRSSPAKRSCSSAPCRARSRARWRRSSPRDSGGSSSPRPGPSRKATRRRWRDLPRRQPAHRAGEGSRRPRCSGRGRSRAGTRPILVTGSFYMVAEIRRLLDEESPRRKADP